MSESHSTEEAFTAVYRRRIVSELAQDLDKLRRSADFSADDSTADSHATSSSSSSQAIQVLINALEDGAALFSEQEMKRIVDAGAK